MTIDERLRGDSAAWRVEMNEAHIRATIRAARASFAQAEAAAPMMWGGFLQFALRHMHKRWWLAQTLVLLALWYSLPEMTSQLQMVRALGVGASLFVILAIPELAKNQQYDAIEIEATTYYSLRQIYAARMLILGLADVVIVTVFCIWLSLTAPVSLSLLLVHFLLPLTLTACLCFVVLADRHCRGVVRPVSVCIGASGLWWLFFANAARYDALSTPLWLGILALALVVLAALIRQWMLASTRIWEGSDDGTVFE
ncbi:MAG: hypothetical protein Q4C56_06255 [Peptococcaceae bacterium]|nr:hypothetical protein [Peptococcaceae bacterium]